MRSMTNASRWLDEMKEHELFCQVVYKYVCDCLDNKVHLTDIKKSLCDLVDNEYNRRNP